MRMNRLLILTGGFLLLLGARLPWISVPVLFEVEGPAFEAIAIGWEGDGLITGGMGLILLLLGVFGSGGTRRSYSVPGALLAVVAVFVVIGDFYHILELDPEAGFLAATDIGIYITLAGASLAFAGVLYRAPAHQS